MTSPSSIIDADEYLHLALESVRRSDHGAALGYLKEAAARYPEDARIAYMLGAEHAQIGLYDRAEAEMRRAIEIDRSLHVAAFQLGLLQMTQARMPDALTTWAQLDSLADGHALRLFRDGLAALAADQFEEARRLLESGMAANDFSADLNHDMGNLLQRIPSAQVQSSENGAAQPDSPVWFHEYGSPVRPS